MSENELPYICPEHPRAMIKREWEETHCVMGGYPVGTGIKSNFHYFCNDCGRELAAEPPKNPADPGHVTQGEQA